MIIWLRNLIFIVLLLSVIYAVLSISGRYKAKKRLQAEYDAERPNETKTDYMARGLTAYDRSARPKLFLLVFIVPTTIIGVLIYLAQYS
jgi:Ca2+/Na+ antiporter